MLKPFLLTLSLLGLLLLGPGCAEGTAGGSGRQQRSDTGLLPDMDTTILPDLSSVPPDTGRLPQEEMGGTPARRQTTVSYGAGGGTLQTPTHRIRLLVGTPPQANGTLTSPRHTFELGASVPQHAQP